MGAAWERHGMCELAFKAIERRIFMQRVVKADRVGQNVSAAGRYSINIETVVTK
jgi:hypothetical protein